MLARRAADNSFGPPRPIRDDVAPAATEQTARLANWLNNGQKTAVQDPNVTEHGAYNLSGATSDAALLAVTRQPDWKWAITSEDEWYKAAYHKNDGNTANYFDYPTSSNTAPSNVGSDGYTDPGNHANFLISDITDFTIGSPYYRTNVGEFENSASPYDTFDQGGNVLEWNESVLYGSSRGFRGGSFDHYAHTLAASDRYYGPPTDEYDYLFGFRVASVPEPGSITLLTGIALMSLLYWRWRHT